MSMEPPESTGAADLASGELEGEPPLPLLLEVVPLDGDWPDREAIVSAAAGAAAALAAHPAVAHRLPACACLALSSDAAVRRLNRTYRGMDKATNVLAFPSPAARDGPEGPRFVGDVVLADATVRREAAELGLELSLHLQHLVVHGLLHLMGFDHETDAEAEAMETVEIAVLATLGISSPYAQPS